MCATGVTKFWSEKYVPTWGNVWKRWRISAQSGAADQGWVFGGITQFPDKPLSLFEAHTEILRKGKASKPNEFGNVVALQETENQIITHHEVFEKRSRDQRLLLPAIEPISTNWLEFQDGLQPTLGFTPGRMKKRPKPCA